MWVAELFSIRPSVIPTHRKLAEDFFHNIDASSFTTGPTNYFDLITTDTERRILSARRSLLE